MIVPGLTCSWQINRDINGDFDGRTRLDIEYMRRRSMAHDISLLVRTFVVALIKRTGT
jgi:lipopolysaccharide/colanic/teichoic acid biosynthesis glycosyltransferase